MNKEMIDMLYRSLDSDLSVQEREQLDRALAESAELRAEQKQLLAMRGSIKTGTAESFGPFFAERVMNKVKAETGDEIGLHEMFESLTTVFRRVAVVGAVAVIALVALNLNASEDKTFAAAFGVTEDADIEELAESPLISALE